MRSGVMGGTIVCAFAGAVLVGSASPSLCQTAFPTQPIRRVVPFAAGGIIDVAGRLVGERVATELGAAVVIENRQGGGGSIGMRSVVGATPDGYTLVIGGLPPITSVLTSNNAGYDQLTDLKPVAGLMSFDSVFMAGKVSKIASVPDLIARIRSGARVSYGSAGINTPSHFMSAWLTYLAAGGKRADVVAVHYRGGADLISDLLSGETTFAAMTLPVALSQLDTMNILASLSPKRLPQLPDTPSMIEAGLPEYLSLDWRVWAAIYAPRGTPDPVISILSAAINKALRDPRLEEKLAVNAMVPMRDFSPAQLDTFQREQQQHWLVALKSMGLASNERP